MPGRVIDASIAGAIAFVEPRLEEAEALIQGMTLYAPTLFEYELTSIALKKIRAYSAASDWISERLHGALRSDVHLLEVPHVEVLALAQDQRLSTYDASYLWLAQSLGVPLLTFDGDLGRAAGALP